MSERNPLDIHAASIVIDAVCPLPSEEIQYLDWYREGGATALAPTISSTDNARKTLSLLATWHRWLRERPDLLLVRAAADIESAKRSDRLGIYFHLQGTDPIEDELDLIDLYKALGVGIIQLTYNVRNRVGDGCEERTDAGLSRFGIKLIERLNAARVIVDCSHTGVRTSLEAIECSTAPVVLSHSNSNSVHTNARNVPDELIKSIARSDGLIGIAGFPSLVAATRTPSLDHFIDHIEAITRLVGIDHVGLGIDYYTGQHGVATLERAQKTYEEARQSGIWSAAYPPPPHHYPAGIETPRTLQNLTRRLLERNHTESDIRKILGENWLRVMRSVWD